LRHRADSGPPRCVPVDAVVVLAHLLALHRIDLSMSSGYAAAP